MRFSLYIGFALLSSSINLLAQAIVMRSLTFEHAFVLALLTGTGTAWIVKYLLDKHCVFRHKTGSRRELAGNMATHASAGVLTTLVFWSIETGFHLFVPLEHAMYIGAVVGLSVSYVLRYQVDRLYVFRSSRRPSFARPNEGAASHPE